MRAEGTVGVGVQLRREVAQSVVQPAAPKGPSNKFYVDFVARLSALSLLRPSLDNVRCSTVGTTSRLMLPHSQSDDASCRPRCHADLRWT